MACEESCNEFKKEPQAHNQERHMEDRNMKYKLNLEVMYNGKKSGRSCRNEI